MNISNKNYVSEKTHFFLLKKHLSKIVHFLKSTKIKSALHFTRHLRI